MTEDEAKTILVTAWAEERCAELLTCLFEGGTCTVDPSGKLVLMSGEQLRDMIGGAG